MKWLSQEGVYCKASALHKDALHVHKFITQLIGEVYTFAYRSYVLKCVCERERLTKRVSERESYFNKDPVTQGKL